MRDHRHSPFLGVRSSGYTFDEATSRSARGLVMGDKFANKVAALPAYSIVFVERAETATIDTSSRGDFISRHLRPFWLTAQSWTFDRQVTVNANLDRPAGIAQLLSLGAGRWCQPMQRSSKNN